MNIDNKTVLGFGDEWSRFDQSALAELELNNLFKRYFSIFPWDSLPSDPNGFDLGCGSGRWAKLVAPKVGALHCIDPSSAIEVAKKNLENLNNCLFHKASVDEMPIADMSMDFGYSIGVLHHVPNTLDGIKSCVNKLKPGAPFLIYLYYAMDNKSFGYRSIWRLSEILRFFISKFPPYIKYLSSQLLAFFVYWPLARCAFVFDKLGIPVNNMPLSSYRALSLYTMRTDALDRFGTRLEQRFTRKQIEEMLRIAGLEKIVFSESEPYWCAVGFKSNKSS
jgi:SAM-dependent methyltransferase